MAETHVSSGRIHRLSSFVKLLLFLSKSMIGTGETIHVSTRRRVTSHVSSQTDDDLDVLSVRRLFPCNHVLDVCKKTVILDEDGFRNALICRRHVSLRYDKAITQR
jgi:hypothetical protein